MARIRVFLVLALAITVGGAFAFATYNYVQKIPPKTVTIPTKPVVVAAADLDTGAEIGRDDIRVVQWPDNALPTGAIGDPNEVIGHGLILPVVQNEPILPNKIASKEAGSGLPPAIPPGLRAVSVKVNEIIGVAGYVLPGTRVDVVATVSPNQQPSEMTSKVILTNVQVLAAGTRIDRNAEKNKPVQVNVVTLLVNPDEAERLTLASTEGKIQLALRNPLDISAPATTGIKPAVLLGLNATTPKATLPRKVGTTANAAPAAGPSPVTVEIIRGDKRTREAVREE